MEDLVEEVENTGICMDDYVWTDQHRRFECTTNGSNKFYEVFLEDGKNEGFVVRSVYGPMFRVKGTVKTVWRQYLSDAEEEVSRIVRKRLDHGYVEVEVQ